jgi:hypothetical protein
MSYIIRVKRIGEQGTALAVTSNRSRLRSNTKFIDEFNLMMHAILSSEMQLLNKSHAVSHPRRLHSYLITVSCRKLGTRMMNKC